QNMEDVAEFVGLQGTGHSPLPPEALFDKWITVLRASQRYVRQIPNSRLAERAIENRDRSIRLLSHHIFRIGEAFLETALGGVEYRTNNANVPPADGSCLTRVEIAAYGDGIIERIENWWARLEDKSCRQKVRTFYGTPPMHQLFERSTWHSAQHARQMIAVLERFGIEPDDRLTAEDLAGLPLPERIWE
ncbi:MAG TPA: DinB family protein, partial [Candidatus Polarisedimenticolaceae bacterium]|nr:DinB family protein [Candidatus Polarisedimenticolaceae bacterium]